MLRSLAFVAAFAALVQGAGAAGLKALDIPGDAADPPLHALVWTPCAAPAAEIPAGPFTLKAARGCPVMGDALPLVVISHGHGGDAISHHDLAETLADAGFMVAAVEHPGDTRADMGRALSWSEIVERPRDMRRLIDALLTYPPYAGTIDAGRIAFFGFSMGGFTGLTLAGGQPDFAGAKLPCPDPAIPVCAEIALGQTANARFVADPRIRAFVVADPLDVFPTPDDLAALKAPV